MRRKVSLSKTNLSGTLAHTVRTPRPTSSRGVESCERLRGESVDGKAIFVSGSTACSEKKKHGDEHAVSLALLGVQQLTVDRRLIQIHMLCWLVRLRDIDPSRVVLRPQPVCSQE